MVFVWGDSNETSYLSLSQEISLFSRTHNFFSILTKSDEITLRFPYRIALFSSLLSTNSHRPTHIRFTGTKSTPLNRSYFTWAASCCLPSDIHFKWIFPNLVWLFSCSMFILWDVVGENWKNILIGIYWLTQKIRSFILTFPWSLSHLISSYGMSWPFPVTI